MLDESARAASRPAGRVFRGGAAGPARPTPTRRAGSASTPCARYLHDLSNDDTRDAALADDGSWVVRRTVVDVAQPPALPRAAVAGDVVRRHRQPVGRAAGVARWATAAARVEAASLWVYVDLRVDDARSGSTRDVPRPLRRSRRRSPAVGLEAACWPGPRRRGRRARDRGRCAAPTSTCSATSTTPPTGAPSRSSWGSGPSSCAEPATAPSSSSPSSSASTPRSRLPLGLTVAGGIRAVGSQVAGTTHVERWQPSTARH